MAEDENVGNNDQPSIETSPIVVDHLPINEIDDAFIESNAINLAVDGKKFFSSSFPSLLLCTGVLCLMFLCFPLKYSQRR